MERNTKYKKQVSYSFIYKAFSILMSFILIKLQLNYLGIELYGVWSVLLIFISWIVFFDLGLTNGLKNTIAISLAKNDYEEARKHISTGYIALLILVSIIYFIFFILSSFLNWQDIFNLYSITNSELKTLMRFIIFLILLNFTLSLITSIYHATQESSFVVLNQFLSQLLAVILVVIISYYTNKDIVLLGIVYGLALIISNIILSISFFRKNINLKPSLKKVDFSKLKGITSLGLKFFILQFTILIILSTDRVLITQLIGPSEVALYDILFKYFSVITILHSLINAPLWSIYTEAYEKNDFLWIQKTLIKMVKLFLFYIFLCILMIIAGDLIIKLWINNEKINYDLYNYIYMATLVLFLSWYSVFAYFTNGINKTKIQLYCALIGALINIPLTILFIKYFDMGINGVVLATIISLSIFSILGPIQSYKEIKSMKLKAHENA